MSFRSWTNPSDLSDVRLYLDTSRINPDISAYIGKTSQQSKGWYFRAFVKSGNGWHRSHAGLAAYSRGMADCQRVEKDLLPAELSSLGLSIESSWDELIAVIPVNHPKPVETKPKPVYDILADLLASLKTIRYRLNGNITGQYRETLETSLKKYERMLKKYRKENPSRTDDEITSLYDSLPNY